MDDTELSSKETAKKSKKPLWAIILGISAAAVLVGGILLATMLTPAKTYSPDPENPAPTTTEALATEAEEPPVEYSTVQTEEGELVDPVDWEYFHDLNEDVYAWIMVPGCGINLPVLQSGPEEDDNLYLHTDINGNYLFAGEIYSQKANAKDFSDPVTVLYGHNMKKEGERFTNLLYFQDEEFFKENEFFYIYTPGHMLTYRIASAHSYDTRHILNNYDFSKEEDFQEYLDYILSPRTMIANVREGVELTTEDHIVTLSTCIYVNGEKIRYLVQGVLVDDQPTN